MKPSLSRFERMDLLREAAESSWVRDFIKHYENTLTHPDKLLYLAREGIFAYLRERYRGTLYEQGFDPDAMSEILRSIAADAVIVKPRHREGAHVITGVWNITELGDTHDGGYEVVAR